MTPELARDVANVTAARERLRGRPAWSIADALAAAAARWRDDRAVRADLARETDLSPSMLDAVVPLVAGMVDADALVDLHAREAGPDGPALVVDVLASNVPALAVPAIALACLAGAAVVVKSGRGDRVSAPAFARALAAVDPALGATVLATYWPGGTVAVEEAVFAAADVVVATGTDAAVAAVAARGGRRVVRRGARTSVAVVAGDASEDEVRALALDVARYEQRGCLSPRTVFVVGDAAGFARRLVAALEALATDLPLPAGTAARARRRLALEAARFAGATVLEGRGGAVLLDPGPADDELLGERTTAVRPIARPADAVGSLPQGRIECVGVGAGIRLDAEALRRRGVARLCPVGRMQRPRIDWPCGQRPALGVLFRGSDEPRIQVES